MGVDIESKNFDYSMSYGAFGKMRVDLCCMVAGEYASDPKSLITAICDTYWRCDESTEFDVMTAFIVKCKERHGKRVAKDLCRLINFTFKPDAIGRIKRKWCKSICRLMDSTDEWKKVTSLYGYIGRGEDYCLTLGRFYDMLRDGADNDGIRWW